MKHNSILLCILFAIAANLFTTAKAQVNTTDSLALVDLYNSTDGPKWYIYTNWLTTAPVSTWHGITVTKNRVKDINLVENNLSGPLPSSIGNLINLQQLNLYGNQLSGAISATIGKLVNLTGLQLASNQLTGAIPPEIGKLSNLYELFLNHNQLTGTIPPVISKLVNLTELSLNNNQLTGTIPLGIGNLKNLTILSLNNNQLTGTIPPEIGNIVNLNELYLQYNQLSGAIPASFSNLIYTVDVSHNLLSEDKNIKLSTSEKYYVNGYINYNLFTFDGLEFLANNYPNINYFPQNTILPIHQTGNILSVYAGGKLCNNTYIWKQVRVAKAIVIKKDSTFTPSQSGMYYVTVKNKVANQLTLYSDTIKFVMPAAQQSSNTLIAKAAQSATIIKHMVVYPNPAKDIIHVQVNGNTIVTLTNSSGKVLLSKTINNSGEINVSGYANSVYYLQNKTTGETQKVVVVH